VNYRHSYHAGNFADIFKHITLVFCLEKLHEKETPFFVLDTHAGIGKYNLQNEDSLKTGEASEGIHNFLETANLNNQDLKNYLKIIDKINLGKFAKLAFLNQEFNKKADQKNDDFWPQIRFYPGSPYIIKYFLRSQDKAIFSEIQRQEFLQLKRNFAGNKKVQYLNEDGFLLLKSKLPPLEKRGLVLIDPAFEKNSNLISQDYKKSIDALQDAQKRFSHGIYLLWHPVINKDGEQETLQKFYNDIFNLKFEKILHIIFENDEKNNSNRKMNACGVFIINAPWEIEKKLSLIFNNKLKIKIK